MVEERMQGEGGRPPVSVDEILYRSMTDADAKECLEDAWGFYTNNNNPTTRSSLFGAMEKVCVREACRPIVESMLRKMIDEAYETCLNADTHGDNCVQVLGTAGTFNRIIYKVGILGYDYILNDYQEKIEKVQQMEENAKPNHNEALGGPKAGD